MTDIPPTKFRKKPVVVEAWQWNGGNPFYYTATPEWLRVGIGVSHVLNNKTGEEKIAIETLEGIITASPRDWIIRGVKGELYPCKPDIFEATYEPA